jgi:radical SAM superfamily enzyme YgiQ (UPF0313 family)
VTPRVLLLSCYDLGHQPLGLAWPLAFLEGAGIPAGAVDLAVDPFPDAAVSSASFVGISVPMHTALRIGVEAAARVRDANPAAHVCFYGLYAWLNSDALLAGPADSVLAGETEASLVALVRALAEGRDPASVPGVSTATHRSEPVLERLRFPAPRRDTLPPLARYAAYVENGRTVAAGSVEASRGCLHLCRHCPVVPIYGGRFFAVPLETVMADVRAQVAAGARHITFGDPDFLNGPGHARRVVEALHREFPALTFDFTAKIEHVLKHRALFPFFAEAGCRFVVSAVESTADRVLARLRKGHTAADVDEALTILDAAGIALHPTLVAFTPWTTLDDYLDQIEFFRARGLAAHVPPIQLSIRLLVPPSSALLEDPGTAEWLGPLDVEAFTYRWTHLDPRMDRLRADVAAVVEEAAASGEASLATWERIRSLAYATAGRGPAVHEPAPPLRPTPPRLTESWFCCSEPTRGQLSLGRRHSLPVQPDVVGNPEQA